MPMIAYSTGIGARSNAVQPNTAATFSDLVDAVLNMAGPEPPADARADLAAMRAWKAQAALPFFSAPMVGGKRSRANAQPWPVLVLDVDGIHAPTGEVEDVQRRLLDLLKATAPVAVYSTLSSTAAVPRLRVLLHCDRAIGTAESKRLAAALTAHIQESLGVAVYASPEAAKNQTGPHLIIDPSMQDAAHIAFGPRGKFKKMRCAQAAPLPVDDWLDLAPQGAKANDEPAPQPVQIVSDFGRPYSAQAESEMRTALDRLPANTVEERASWLKIITTIKAHGWPDHIVEPIARDWSAQSPKFDPARWLTDWESLKVEGGITASTLYYLAGPSTAVSDCPPAHTDDGAACRFAAWLGGNVIYARGTFHVWSGAFWRPDDAEVAGLLKQYANEAAQASHAAFLAAPEDARSKGARSAADRLLNTTKQDCVLKALKVMLRVRDAQLDRDPYLLACNNGTVNLRTGQLKPADPADYITQCTGHDYDAAAAAPHWEKFLKDAIGDPDCIDWFQRYLGYATSGDVREELLLLTTGPGGSGKSTALNAVMYALGGGSNPHGYATAAASALLSASATRRNANEHTAGLLPLVGKRLAAVNEVAVAEKWDDSLLKQLVSTEPMVMRASGGTHAFTVQPTWKLWIRGNHTPVIRDTSSGLWRRIAILQFSSPPARKNLKLDEVLRADAPEILAWLVRGCLEWQRRGLDQPAQMRQAVESFQADQDCLGEWLEACTEHGGFTTSVNLLSSYMLFSRQRRASSSKAWGTMLKERGIRDSKNGKGIRGFALTVKPDPDFLDGGAF